MYVGILIAFLQGWWLLGSANVCVNTTISNVFGEIGYLPPSSKLRVPKDCVWTVEPPGEQDFLFILKLNHLSAYDNDDDLIFPDRASLPRQTLSFGTEPVCFKYVLAEQRTKPCLEQLGEAYCPETTRRLMRKPIRITISTLPYFQKASASYFYTNFQASYLFIFCEESEFRPDASPVDEGIEVQGELDGEEEASNPGVATTIIFIVFLIIAIIIIILLCLKIRHDKEKNQLEEDVEPMQQVVEEAAPHPVKAPRPPKQTRPSSGESSLLRKKDRDVSWMDLLTLESQSDPGCWEASRMTTTKSRGCEDPPCNDVPFKVRKRKINLSNPSRPSSARQTPQTLSCGSLELPATFENYATEEAVLPRLSENNSYVTTVDRSEYRAMTSGSSSNSFNSEVHPTYTMRTLNLTFARPSRSEVVFDETCHEIHAALESICNSEDMETASVIASTIAGDEKCHFNAGKRGFCKAGQNFNQVTGAVMCLTVFLVMCILQISKRLEAVGAQKSLFDPLRICRQIQAAKTSRCNSETTVCVRNTKSPDVKVRSASRGQESAPSRPKSPMMRGEESAARGQVKFAHKRPVESHSESSQNSGYRGNESERSSEPASSMTSPSASEEYVTRSNVKGIMKQRRQTGKAQKRSSFAKILDRVSLPNVFSSKKVDVESQHG